MRTESNDPRATHAQEVARKAAILNPPPPRPKLDAVKIHRKGQFAGVRVEAGGIVPVWPTAPPGWLTAEEARELVDGLMGEPASAEEVEAFLAAQEEGGSEP